MIAQVCAACACTQGVVVSCSCQVCTWRIFVQNLYPANDFLDVNWTVLDFLPPANRFEVHREFCFCRTLCNIFSAFGAPHRKVRTVVMNCKQTYLALAPFSSHPIAM